MTFRVVACLAVYFISGFAALMYQVIWQRTLVIFSGADVHSATLVVGAFMAGLGCGSAAGGYIADRLSLRASLALFAAVEVGVAIFGFFSTTFFYDVLYQRFGSVDIELASMAAILFVALLWPTFLMGMSLPLLSRGLITDISQAPRIVGWLYGFNTLGAALGALCATWLLVPQIGLDGGVRVAATLSLVCAAAILPFAMALTTPAIVDADGTRGSASDRVEVHPSADAARSGIVMWTLLFAASGFVGLSLEIVWFRLLGVMVKSTSFTFGTLLGIYLLGLGLGGVLGGFGSRWIKRPAIVFLALQAAAGLYAALSLTLFITGSDQPRWLTWFTNYFAGYDAVDVRQALNEWLRGGAGSRESFYALLKLYVVLPALLVIPPTIFAGFSFAVLQRVVQRDLGHLGRRVGTLLAANIVGSTVGTFVTGWILLDAIGTAGTLRLLFILSSSFGFIALKRALQNTGAARRTVAYAVLFTVVGGVVVAMPSQSVLWSQLHGTGPTGIIVEEDGSGVSVLKGERQDFARVIVFVNGLGQSWIPYGDIHTVLGALPAFVHPDPRTAALIGLGSGDTLYALAGRHDLERITSIEIVRPQLATLRTLLQRAPYPGLQAILSDQRIEHVFGDGRTHIRRGGRHYDIIQADALRPASAYSGNLYSDAYFRLIRDHLSPGGLAVTWAPTPRIAQTFIKVFPYVLQHGDIMIGSDAQIPFDRGTVRARIDDPKVRDYYAQAGIDIARLLKPYVDGHWRSFDASFDRSAINDVNTDLYPRDEFDIPAVIDLSGLARLVR